MRKISNPASAKTEAGFCFYARKLSGALRNNGEAAVQFGSGHQLNIYNSIKIGQTKGDAMYYHANNVRQEMRARLLDEEFQKIVAEFFQHNTVCMPPGFPTKPCAVLVRPIATIRREDEYFFEEARKLRLPVVWAEYPSCAFSADDFSHEGLVRIAVQDVHKWDGMSLASILTDEGDPLVNFHHRARLVKFTTKTAQSIVDISLWCKQYIRDSEYDWYMALLALAMSGNVVLFENFGYAYHLNEGKRFGAMQKALSEMFKCFDKRPLTVNLPVNRCLHLYPKEVGSIALYSNGGKLW